RTATKTNGGRNEVLASPSPPLLVPTGFREVPAAIASLPRPPENILPLAHFHPAHDHHHGAERRPAGVADLISNARRQLQEPIQADRASSVRVGPPGRCGHLVPGSQRA